MKKRLLNSRMLSLIMCIMFLVVSMACFSGCGEKKQVQVFTYEENEDGSLTITGLTEKGRTDSRLSIPSEIDGKTVSAIGREAFRDNVYVTEIVMPDGLVRIAENAFFSCTKLSDITFSKDLKEVGTNAIRNTAWEKTQLQNNKEIIIGDILVEVGEIGNSYSIPEDVKRIASGVFYCNETLTEVYLPENLEYIGSYAFAECKNLQNIHIPESVEVIGFEAFLNIPEIQYAGNADGSPWGAGAVK